MSLPLSALALLVRRLHRKGNKQADDNEFADEPRPDRDGDDGPEDDDHDGGRGGPGKIALVVGGCVLVLVIVALTVWWCRRRRLAAAKLHAQTSAGLQLGNPAQLPAAPLPPAFEEGADATEPTAPAKLLGSPADDTASTVAFEPLDPSAAGPVHVRVGDAAGAAAAGGGAGAPPAIVINLV